MLWLKIEVINMISFMTTVLLESEINLWKIKTLLSIMERQIITVSELCYISIWGKCNGPSLELI